MPASSTQDPSRFCRSTPFRHEFDVNVFGALSVMNAFLPALRKARGRIVQVSTLDRQRARSVQWTVGCIEGCDGRRFATVYRAELKRFGIDVVVAAAGNMKTGGPAKTAAALKRVADGMTPETARAIWTNLRIVRKPLSTACRAVGSTRPPPPGE